MSQIGRERILHTFAHVFESDSNTVFIMLSGEGISSKVLTNPYIKPLFYLPRLKGEGRGEVLSRKGISIGGNV